MYEAESGETFFQAWKKAKEKIVSERRVDIVVVHNDTHVIVYPNSEYNDSATIYDLKRKCGDR